MNTPGATSQRSNSGTSVKREDAHDNAIDFQEKYLKQLRGVERQMRGFGWKRHASTSSAISGSLSRLVRRNRHWCLAGRGSQQMPILIFPEALREQFQCEEIWRDTLCNPREKAARTEAIRRIQSNYQDTRFNLVHDVFLPNWEWTPKLHALPFLCRLGLVEARLPWS